jgi:uncharacterized protein YjbI with pentapeptide repeats
MADPEHLRIAREGKSAWDSWRRSHPSERADFSGTDFTVGKNRDIVFSGFEFEGDADFSDTIFGDAPLPYRTHTHGTGPRGSPNGAALFDGAVFRKDANFRHAKFGHNARFDGAVFESGAEFTDATFLNEAEFSAAVFGYGGFSHARFGDSARFRGVLFPGGPSFDFESAVFGNHATFEGASFERASFYMSRFGHQPNFDDCVFAAGKDTAVQFNDAVFGDNASFKGTVFDCRAYFNEAEFGDRAGFEARDQLVFKDAAAARAMALPERYREVYLRRANTADSQAFHDISFSGAQFGEGTVNRSGSESWAVTIRLFFPRLLHSPESRRMRVLDPGPGASFRGRLLQGLCDFSRVQFDQPPDFGGVGQADNLDLSGASFSFRGATWPRWRYWTTHTATATRIRRLRKLASDIHAEDAERDLLALARMVGLGIEWSMWWADVVRPWDYHRMMRPAADDDGQPDEQRRRPHWLRCIATSAWFALRGVGRPAVWTALTLLYRVLSDFGRSVVLPTLWFFVSLLAFGLWYGRYTTLALSLKTAKALGTFTLANSIPFAGSSRKAFEESVAVLFSGGIPIAVHLIGLLNGLVSAVLLFLVIFAVRNRFRIG